MKKLSLIFAMSIMSLCSYSQEEHFEKTQWPEDIDMKMSIENEININGSENDGMLTYLCAYTLPDKELFVSQTTQIITYLDGTYLYLDRTQNKKVFFPNFTEKEILYINGIKYFYQLMSTDDGYTIETYFGEHKFIIVEKDGYQRVLSVYNDFEDYQDVTKQN